MGWSDYGLAALLWWGLLLVAAYLLLLVRGVCGAQR